VSRRGGGEILRLRLRMTGAGGVSDDGPHPNPSPKFGGGAEGRGLYLTPLDPPVDGGKGVE